ncbi:TPA: GDSL family lipase, partial [Klebsiella pneumoniae]|nr:GDSL family lipase [Klebsiella pneumoniae]
MAFNPELGSTSPAVLLDNAERLDKLVNGSALTEPDRAGVELDTWRGMMAKNDQVTEDARKSITALGLPYSTLSEAQAAVNNGQIPV